MLQAIHTHWLGPTNLRGARIKAVCESRSLTVPYDHSVIGDVNHETAARTLWELMEWNQPGFRLVGGCLPGNGGYAWVQFRDPPAAS